MHLEKLFKAASETECVLMECMLKGTANLDTAITAKLMSNIVTLFNLILVNLYSRNINL